jgi:probable HAF family extracellular repeat protein
MFLAPNGQVFNAGPNQVTRYLNTTGTGAWTAVGNLNYSGTRDYGSAVFFDGKILVAGGDGSTTGPATNTAEIIDLNASNPSWTNTSLMAGARRQHNLTLLPDGKVLVSGGSGGFGFDNANSPVYAAEMWDPSTGKWTTMDSVTAYRGYHSTALLLPNGRVLSAGGEQTGASAEIYSPPYLFKGARPTITSAPSSVKYGQTFSLPTPDAASITQVTWIRLGSVTHSFNFSAAFDVNSRGAVVGDSNTATNLRAFLWDASGGLRDLGALPGDTGSRAYGINDSDLVVGYSSGPHGVTAFSWKSGSGMTSLGTLPGGDMSQAYDINNGGVIVGVASTSTGERHAVLWTSPGTIRDLGTLSGYVTSEARRINNAGDVIGSASGPGGTRAVFWPSSGGIQNLGTLGGDFSTALDFNNRGELVGSSTGPLGARAFYWTSSAGMLDLNSLISSNSEILLTTAIGINNKA